MKICLLTFPSPCSHLILALYTMILHLQKTRNFYDVLMYLQMLLGTLFEPVPHEALDCQKTFPFILFSDWLLYFVL